MHKSQSRFSRQILKTSYSLTALIIGFFLCFQASPAQGSDLPTVQLSVSERLDDGQYTLVSWTGLVPGEDVKIYECKRGTTLATECGGVTWAQSGADGSGSYPFRVTRTNDIDIKIAGAPFLSCDLTHDCEIRVFSVSDRLNYASQDITFIQGAGGCPESQPGAITGKGTAGMARAFASWGPDICLEPTSVPVDYVPENDPFGLHDFNCSLIDYAITDSGLGDHTCASATSPRKIAGLAPIALTSISLAFNMRDGQTGERISKLVLSPELVARIFTGQLNTLDIPAVRALNPGVNLPTKLYVAVRADSSAATLALTTYLNETAHDTYVAGGLHQEFIGGPTDTFPVVSGVEPATGETKVLNSIVSPDPSPLSDTSVGWIGYVSSAAAEFAALPSVSLQSADGSQVVAPTKDSVLRAFDNATKATDGSYTFDYTPSDAKAYPLSAVSSIVVPELTIGDVRLGTFKKFVQWAVTVGQNDKYLPRGYVALPGELASQALDVVGAAGVKPSASPTPTPTPTPSPSASTSEAPIDMSGFGSTTDTTTVDTSGSTTAGPIQLNNIERVSAFSTDPIEGNATGRLFGIAFVIYGAGSLFRLIKGTR